MIFPLKWYHFFFCDYAAQSCCSSYSLHPAYPITQHDLIATEVSFGEGSFPRPPAKLNRGTLQTLACRKELASGDFHFPSTTNFQLCPKASLRNRPSYYYFILYCNQPIIRALHSFYSSVKLMQNNINLWHFSRWVNTLLACPRYAKAWGQT